MIRSRLFLACAFGALSTVLAAPAVAQEAPEGATADEESDEVQTARQIVVQAPVGAGPTAAADATPHAGAKP